MSAFPASDLRKLLPQFALIAASPVFFGLLAVPAIGWLPPAGRAAEVLGALLAAQAAIAALSLAVVLFALERVSARPDADDRIFAEYVRRSWMRPLFLGGLVAVASTGSVLVAGGLAAQGAPIAEAAPGLRNFIILAGAAFFASVALPAVLFERAVRLARPGAWRELRREVNEQNVRDSVRAFIARQQRLQRGDLRDGEDPLFTQMIPDPGEGSADEAIRALLEDARRAIDERRDADFSRSLDSIVGLVEFAMDELEREGIEWDLPGSVPYWPPLAEWRDTSDSFREEVITRGRSGYAGQLAMLDRRMVLSGLKRNCRELFSAGLEGCVRNYELAYGRRDRQVRDTLRNFAARDLEWVFHSDRAGDVAYLREVIRHHARLLFHAMRHEDADDFQWLRKALAEMLANGKSIWAHEQKPRPTDEEVEDIEHTLRYVVMGLAGYSMRLAEIGAIADADPYIEAARSEFQSLQRLVGEFASPPDGASELRFLWENLDMSGPDRFGTGWVGPVEYVLPFFSVRLVELAENPMLELGLGRTAAQTARWWFDTNVDRVRGHIKLDDGLTVDPHIARVRDALRAAAGPSG